MVAPSRKQRDGRSKSRPGVDAQRRQLLDTAIALFAERGSRNVSVADLCSAAEVSRPTFYRCFADKDALVAELYQDSVMGPVQAMMLLPLEARSGEPGWLRKALDQMLDAIFEESEVAALLFVESSDPSSPAHGIIQHAFDETSETLRRAMTRTGARPLSVVTIKALLVACQWIVHDAIQKGLTPAARRAAKDATWELASRAFSSGTR